MNFMLLISLFIVFSSFAAHQGVSQKIVDNIASNLEVKYKVVTNDPSTRKIECSELGAEWASCNLVNIILKNNGKEIKEKDWKIYFSSIRKILKVNNEQFKIKHITGTLNTLEPTDKFKGIAKNEKIVIPYVGEYWVLSESDYIPNLYVTSGNAIPKIINSTNKDNASSYVDSISIDNIKNYSKKQNVVIATPLSRFAKNSNISLMPVKSISGSIIPTPLKTTLTGQYISLVDGVKINNSAFPKDMLLAIKKRFKILGIKTDGKYPVNVKIDDSFFDKYRQAGAYNLDIKNKEANIIGYDKNGAFYGMQSLIGLLNVGANNKIPTLKIYDAPRFAYRGVMIDVARNFHSKKIVLKTIDQMAAYKMNVLHLHLSDDEGWRIEIPGLPELTDVGSKRCHDLSETKCLIPQLGSGPTTESAGSGYYSREDFIDIIKYAKARGISVVPELDMPGHSRAAVVSMENRYKKYADKGDMEAANKYRLLDPNDTSNITTVQFFDGRSLINPCLESSFTFTDKIITEIQKMYVEAGANLNVWHFGGDEAKNIKLGGGYQDINAKKIVSWKGIINKAVQDEPFSRSPLCKKLIYNNIVKDSSHLISYFAEKVSEIVKNKGIDAIQAWQDGIKHSKNASSFATKNVNVNFWDTLFWGGVNSANDFAEKKYRVILSNPDYLYMDMPYEADPLESGFYWAARNNDTRKIFSFAPENLPQNAETSLDRNGNEFKGKGEKSANRFYGLSAQLWSEIVRTDKKFEYMVFPRLLAVAERAWHKAYWEKDYKIGVEYSQSTNLVNKELLNKDWQRFANILGQRELAKLGAANISYRIPLPGAEIKNGVLEMNISMPGLSLQYSIDSGKFWNDYDIKSKINNSSVLIRAVSADGKRHSRVTSLKP